MFAVALAVPCSAVCSRSAVAPPAASRSAATPAEHEHHAPHSGRLIELGNEFSHIELVLERDSGTLTAFVLDGEAENALRIQQGSLDLIFDTPAVLAGRTVPLAARSNVLTGETQGDSSEFTVTSDALRSMESLRGRIAWIAVRGSTFENVRFQLDP